MKNIIVYPEGSYAFVLCEDAQLLKQCRVDTYCASGPGGQHRNRTYSAVRITHIPTGLSAIAEESRSQHENKARALKRIKKTIALAVRSDPATGGMLHDAVKKYFLPPAESAPNAKNPLYPAFCAAVLDMFYAVGGKMSLTAQHLHSSTGKLNKLLSSDRDLFSAANLIREHFSLMPLKKG